MTYRCLDSIYVQNLPPGADAYLGYTGGRWPTFATLQRFFPDAHLISMAISASEDAEGLDVETGDATIAQIYGWYMRQRARGVWRPIVYHSASEMNDVVTTMTGNGFARPSYRLLSAHYGDGEHICGPDSCGLVDVDCDGTQYTDAAAGLNGSRIDASVLAADFFAPPPAPTPQPTQEDNDMTIVPTTLGAIPLAVPYGTGNIRLLCPGATETAPLKLKLTWLNEGKDAETETLDWGTGPVGVAIKPKRDEGRLDVLEGAGPLLGIQCDPRAAS